jgi:hypothetical protein
VRSLRYRPSARRIPIRGLVGERDALDVAVEEAHRLLDEPGPPGLQLAFGVDLPPAHVVELPVPGALGTRHPVEERERAVGLRVGLQEALRHEQRRRGAARRREQVARLPERIGWVVDLLLADVRHVAGGVRAGAVEVVGHRVLGGAARSRVAGREQRGRAHRVREADPVHVQVAIARVDRLHRQHGGQALRALRDRHEPRPAVVGLAEYPDPAGRPRLRRRPLDRRLGVHPLARPAPVVAPGAAAEAAQVDDHVGVAALPDPRGDGEVREAAARPGAALGVARVRAHRQQDGGLRGGRQVRRTQDVGVQQGPVARLEVGLGPGRPRRRGLRLRLGGRDQGAQS